MLPTFPSESCCPSGKGLIPSDLGAPALSRGNSAPLNPWHLLPRDFCSSKPPVPALLREFYLSKPWSLLSPEGILPLKTPLLREFCPSKPWYLLSPEGIQPLKTLVPALS